VFLEVLVSLETILEKHAYCDLHKCYIKSTELGYCPNKAGKIYSCIQCPHYIPRRLAFATFGDIYNKGEIQIADEGKMVKMFVPAELLLMGAEEAQKAFLEMTAAFTDERIAEMWHLDVYLVKKIRTRLSISKNRKGEVTGAGPVEKWPIELEPVRKHLGTIAMLVIHSEEKEIDQVVMPEPGFTVTINGQFSGQNVAKRLSSLGLIIDDAETEYDIILTLKEMPKPGRLNSDVGSAASC
jgi:hypothetical protein